MSLQNRLIWVVYYSLNRKKDILRLIECAYADRIVLVTSGNWARNYNAALKYVRDIEAALLGKRQNTQVVLRISVNKFHAIKIGIEPAVNVMSKRKRFPVNWKPYPFQLPLWQYLAKGGKKASAVWNRRAGKDVLGINWITAAALKTPGAYWYVFPQPLRGYDANHVIVIL